MLTYLYGDASNFLAGAYLLIAITTTFCHANFVNTISSVLQIAAPTHTIPPSLSLVCSAHICPHIVFDKVMNPFYRIQRVMLHLQH